MLLYHNSLLCLWCCFIFTRLGPWSFHGDISQALLPLCRLKLVHGLHREMLSYIKSAVTRNASEKKINSTLDFISASTDVKLLQDFYGATLHALADAKNERLWFKTNLKLCGLWFKLQEYSRTARILKELHRCELLSICSFIEDLAGSCSCLM